MLIMNTNHDFLIWKRFVSTQWEIIRSTRRTTDVVLLNVPTNKMFLFMQMWHHLVIFIFYCLCWLKSSLTHLHKWYYLIDWKDHISSPSDGLNNFSYLTYNEKTLSIINFACVQCICSKNSMWPLEYGPRIVCILE